MTQDVFALWVYLARTPLLWLTVTILTYCLCGRLSAALRRHPMANPVLTTTILVGLLVRGTGTPYAAYFDGAQFIHFLLGPLPSPWEYRSMKTANWSCAPFCR